MLIIAPSSSSSFAPLFVAFSTALFLSILDVGLGCLCRMETPEHNYCAADWVAHVLVVKRQDGVRMPASIVDRQNEQNSRHEVKYLQMYKISKQMNVTGNNLVVLPINVYTASEDAACGILLDAGHEYLLAGQYVNGTMVTRLCGQILLEDLKESRKHEILEWGEVPANIKQKLNKQEFEPACQKAAATAKTTDEGQKKAEGPNGKGGAEAKGTSQ